MAQTLPANGDLRPVGSAPSLRSGDEFHLPPERDVPTFLDFIKSTAPVISHLQAPVSTPRHHPRQSSIYQRNIHAFSQNAIDVHCPSHSTSTDLRRSRSAASLASELLRSLQATSSKSSVKRTHSDPPRHASMDSQQCSPKTQPYAMSNSSCYALNANFSRSTTSVAPAANLLPASEYLSEDFSPTEEVFRTSPRPSISVSPVSPGAEPITQTLRDKSRNKLLPHEHLARYHQKPEAQRKAEEKQQQLHLKPSPYAYAQDSFPVNSPPPPYGSPGTRVNDGYEDHNRELIGQPPGLKQTGRSQTTYPSQPRPMASAWNFGHRNVSADGQLETIGSHNCPNPSSQTSSIWQYAHNDPRLVPYPDPSSQTSNTWQHAHNDPRSDAYLGEDQSKLGEFDEYVEKRFSNRDSCRIAPVPQPSNDSPRDSYINRVRSKRSKPNMRYSDASTHNCPLPNNSPHDSILTQESAVQSRSARASAAHSPQITGLTSINESPQFSPIEPRSNTSFAVSPTSNMNSPTSASKKKFSFGHTVSIFKHRSKSSKSKDDEKHTGATAVIDCAEDTAPTAPMPSTTKTIARKMSFGRLKAKEIKEDTRAISGPVPGTFTEGGPLERNEMTWIERRQEAKREKERGELERKREDLKKKIKHVGPSGDGGAGGY